MFSATKAQSLRNSLKRQSLCLGSHSWLDRPLPAGAGEEDGPGLEVEPEPEPPAFAADRWAKRKVSVAVLTDSHFKQHMKLDFEGLKSLYLTSFEKMSCNNKHKYLERFSPFYLLTSLINIRRRFYRDLMNKWR